MPNNPTGHTVREVADMLRCTRQTILDHIANGRLTAIDTAPNPSRPRWVILDCDLQKFIRNRATTNTQRGIKAVNEKGAAE